MIPTSAVYGCLECGCIYHVYHRIPQRCPTCNSDLSHAQKLEGLFP